MPRGNGHEAPRGTWQAARGTWQEARGPWHVARCLQPSQVPPWQSVLDIVADIYIYILYILYIIYGIHNI